MKYNILSLTTGDIDGIGTEVTAKALIHLGPDPQIRYILCRSPHCPQSHLNLLKKQFHLATVPTWEDAFHRLHETSTPPHHILDLVMPEPPTFWFEKSVNLCLEKKISGIVTGPLSKIEMMKSTPPFLGHTELLKAKVINSHPFMAFVGKKFNVLSITGHIPFQSITKILSESLILKGLQSANELRLSLPSHFKEKPLGVLGLNPHAGEEGILGNFEEQVLKPLLKKVQKNHPIPLRGPLVPDAAFLSKYWSQYSIYLCLYHDQGLIPFKIIHGQDSGAHITMGLPFVRTSVDHGTAKELFNLNKANPNSMIDALKWAKYLLEGKKLKTKGEEQRQ